MEKFWSPDDVDVFVVDGVPAHVCVDEVDARLQSISPVVD